MSQAPWHSTVRHQAWAEGPASRLSTWVAMAFLFPPMHWGTMPQISRNGIRAPFLQTKCRVRSRDIPRYLLNNSYDMDGSWWTDAHVWEAEQGLVILHQVCKCSLTVPVGWRLCLKRSGYKVTTSFSAPRDLSIKCTHAQAAHKKSLCKNASTSSKQLPEAKQLH